MVIPPVVVNAGETDRAIQAAVVIEAAMRPRRDKGVILLETEDKNEDPACVRQPSRASFLRTLPFRRV